MVELETMAVEVQAAEVTESRGGAVVEAGGDGDAAVKVEGDDGEALAARVALLWR